MIRFIIIILWKHKHECKNEGFVSVRTGVLPIVKVNANNAGFYQQSYADQRNLESGFNVLR